jgi:tryptophan synthase alpha chain
LVNSTLPLSFKTRPSLVAYITCGDPDLTTTTDIALAAIDAGADVVELGVPFSDPVADGPIIQRASERALRNGTTLSDVLKLAREVRAQRPTAGLIIFSYLNPILRFGLERFCAAAEDAGVDGALVTDLPVEEAGEYLAHMRRRNLATIFLAAPTSTDERLRRIAATSTGFVYAVSRTGVTGTRQDVATDARQLVARLRRFTRLPIAVGFGISTADHVQEVAQFADAAVVGSAIVQAVETAAPPGRAPQAVAELVKKLLANSSQRVAGSTAAPK